ncbi:MAG: hypothetical protein QNM02_20555, partial [Acidimicrobiia bacterium]|nr:hypothetical protein [Acidimicrobiia bacterium]
MDDRADRPGRPRPSTPGQPPVLSRDDLIRAGEQFNDQLTTGAYKLGALAARLTPGFVAAGLAVPFGAGASLASAERRQLIERHLRRVDPTLR